MLQLDAYDPVPINRLESEQAQKAEELSSGRQRAFIREWVTLKQVARRIGFKPEDGVDINKD